MHHCFNDYNNSYGHLTIFVAVPFNLALTHAFTTTYPNVPCLINSHPIAVFFPFCRVDQARLSRPVEQIVNSNIFAHKGIDAISIRHTQ
jgi:hypothetical protein